jgi:uncharacterized protein (DUF427 family)
MRALLGTTVLAEAPESELIKIEGNWYFPPSSLNRERFVVTDTQYHCPWKGDAQYWGVTDGGEVKSDVAWSYPTPYPTAFDRVGKDFSGYVAFGNEVTVVD